MVSEVTSTISIFILRPSFCRNPYHIARFKVLLKSGRLFVNFLESRAGTAIQKTDHLEHGQHHVNAELYHADTSLLSDRTNPVSWVSDTGQGLSRSVVFIRTKGY